MTSDYIWLSEAISVSGKLVNDISESDVDRAIEAEKSNKKGQPVPEDMCLKRVWGDGDAPFFKRLPDLVFAATHWIISDRAAEIFQRFDLGGGAVHPITEGVYQNDNITRAEGEYFTWIFGNTKTAFLEQFSPNAEAMGPSGRGWCALPMDLADDDIAVSPLALEGPDVWLDPTLFQSVFLSRALGDALVDAGMRAAFGLYRSRLIF